MSRASDLRAQEKEILAQIDATRKHLYTERQKIEPLETQLALQKKELAQIQRDLIAELTQQLADKGVPA